MGAIEPRPGRHELYDPPRATDARARSCGGLRGRTEMSRNWVPWSLLGAWLATVVLVVPAGAEDFSLARCLVTGSGSNSGLQSVPQRIDVERHLACYEAQRAYEVRRQVEEAAERQRQAAEEARRQADVQAQETTDQAVKEKTRAREAERARHAEEV